MTLEASRRKSRLSAEADAVARMFGEVAYDREDGEWFHVRRFPLPAGWNKRRVEILIDIPSGTPGYPAVAPQWFWTDWNLRTNSGQQITHFFTEGRQQEDRKYHEKGWGHFCVHLNVWQPAPFNKLRNGHSLLTYLNLIRAIFHDRRTLSGR